MTYTRAKQSLKICRRLRPDLENFFVAEFFLGAVGGKIR
jgi:hypothetical protein